MINSDPGIIRAYLLSLAVYRHLLEDPVIGGLLAFLDSLHTQKDGTDGLIESYHSFYAALAASPAVSLKDYVIDKVLFDETPFSLRVERLGASNIELQLKQAFERDLMILGCCSEITIDWIRAGIFSACSLDSREKGFFESIPSWPEKDLPYRQIVEDMGYGDLLREMTASGDWGDLRDALIGFYEKNGSGSFARYKAFVWEPKEGTGYLKGIQAPDPIRLSDLIGYQTQREVVLENTRQFLAGNPANNVLLYGDRGTGKSSTVKALLNAFHSQGLRLIEVPKRHLLDLPAVMRQIAGRRGKFIIFIDDLAFEDNEENYTSLKAVLEGGIATKPQNTLIYATTNRRHLIRETFSEREGLQSGRETDEVSAADTMQEKLSFADRFGITVVYTAPNQTQFLEIVTAMAAQRGLKLDTDVLKQKALQWEMRYNGRSPRTARQFIDYLEGQHGS